MLRASKITLLLLAAVVAGTLSPAHAGAEGREVPQGFLGTMIDGPALESPTALSRELDQMSRSGVEAVRIAWRWSDLQPYESADEVPSSEAGDFTTVNGVPTRFGPLDDFVTATAKRQIEIVPVVFRTPSWARIDPDSGGSPPYKNSYYANVMKALATRYGNQGTFWDQHPEITRNPIKAWQIWNEPDISRYWDEKPFAPSYVKLLKAANSAILSVDDQAEILLGGLTNLTWEDLEAIYKAGGADYFDAVTVNQFSLEPHNLLKAYRRVRRVMKRYGDSDKPMRITELSWPSAKRYKTAFRYGFEVSERGQADRLEDVLSTLVDRRHELHLQQVLWYTWLSPKLGSNLSFDYSGLRRLNAGGTVIDKPALESFETIALEIEGCEKTTVATQCVQ